jgi:hypothetical protein
MAENELPESVQALLRECIGSYEELEILLLLHQECEPAACIDALASRLRLRPPLVRAALESLQNCALVGKLHTETEPEYRYLPQSSKLDEAVKLLAREYRERPISIIRILNANAIERVRTAALRIFADAFILDKDKHRG